MNYEQARAYAVNVSRSGSILGLDSIENLMHELGDIQEQLKIIHIAGTNGKGSTGAYLERVLIEAGYRVGRYSSPAVFDPMEVWRINLQSMSHEEYADIMEQVKCACDRMVEKGMEHPTIFEVETAMAFLYFYQKKCDYDIIAESWELSAHPDGQSVIADGPYKDMYFGEFIEKAGAATVGWKSGSLDRFPVLIKFIDAKQALSIQIHPDDEYALENENEYGKNEMWYVVDCEPGAYLYCGLSRDASKEEIRKRIENNTITEILNKIEVSKGDCVMVKAGTIHAIGAGILICEIQQNSNCTYRMYDNDCSDKFGNKRELHVDKALDVVDTKRYVPYESSSNAYDEALNEAAATIEEDSPEGQLLVSCKYFECYKYDISDSVSINVDTASFLSVIFTEGCGTIRVGEDVKAYKTGDSFYITAGNKTVEIEGNGGAIVTKV